MPKQSLMRVVIDTNVLFEGLTKEGGAAAGIIEAWLAGLFEVYCSNALVYEYIDVLSRKLSQKRWQQLQPVLGTLLKQGIFIKIYYSWRPTSPDPGDDLVIDCAMNANAYVITNNIRDFATARKYLGLQLMNPTELLTELANTGDR